MSEAHRFLPVLLHSHDLQEVQTTAEPCGCSAGLVNGRPASNREAWGKDGFDSRRETTISMDNYQDGGSMPSLQPEVLTGNFQQSQQEELGSGSASNEVQLAPWPAALWYYDNNAAKSWSGLDERGGREVGRRECGAHQPQRCEMSLCHGDARKLHPEGLGGKHKFLQSLQSSPDIWRWSLLVLSKFRVYRSYKDLLLRGTHLISAVSHIMLEHLILSISLPCFWVWSTRLE